MRDASTGGNTPMAAWHYCAPSCAIALRSPASERSSDLKRHSPADIHPLAAHTSAFWALQRRASEVAAPAAPSLVARRLESDLELPVVLSHHLVTRKQPRTQTTRAASPCRHVPTPAHRHRKRAAIVRVRARAREWGVRTFKLPVSLIFIVPFPFFSSSSESLVRPEKNPWHCDGGR